MLLPQWNMVQGLVAKTSVKSGEQLLGTTFKEGDRMHELRGNKIPRLSRPSTILIKGKGGREINDY